MKIEDDIKLDFADVLIRPKRSNLDSRNKVQLHREFNFILPAGNFSWTGVPIMAANLDGVGTIDMAKALQEQDSFTCLTKNITDFPSDLNTVS